MTLQDRRAAAGASGKKTEKVENERFTFEIDSENALLARAARAAAATVP